MSDRKYDGEPNQNLNQPSEKPGTGSDVPRRGSEATGRGSEATEETGAKKRSRDMSRGKSARSTDKTTDKSFENKGQGLEKKEERDVPGYPGDPNIEKQ